MGKNPPAHSPSAKGPSNPFLDRLVVLSDALGAAFAKHIVRDAAIGSQQALQGPRTRPSSSSSSHQSDSVGDGPRKADSAAVQASGTAAVPQTSANAGDVEQMIALYGQALDILQKDRAQIVSTGKTSEQLLKQAEFAIYFNRAVLHCLHSPGGQPPPPSSADDAAAAMRLAKQSADQRLVLQCLILEASIQVELRQAESALDMFAEALSVAPSVTSHAETAEIHVLRAILHHKMNKKNKAVEDCTLALNLLADAVNPASKLTRTFALVVRGDSYKFGYGSFQKLALADYEVAVSLDDTAASRFIGRGFAFEDKMGACRAMLLRFSSLLATKQPPAVTEYQGGRSKSDAPATRAATATVAAASPPGKRQASSPSTPPVGKAAAAATTTTATAVIGSDVPHSTREPVPPPQRRIQSMRDAPPTQPPPAVPTLDLKSFGRLPWQEDPDSVDRSKYRRLWNEPLPAASAPQTERKSYVRHEPINLDNLSTFRSSYARPWAATAALPAAPSADAGTAAAFTSKSSAVPAVALDEDADKQLEQLRSPRFRARYYAEQLRQANREQKQREPEPTRRHPALPPAPPPQPVRSGRRPPGRNGGEVDGGPRSARGPANDRKAATILGKSRNSSSSSSSTDSPQGQPDALHGQEQTQEQEQTVAARTGGRTDEVRKSPKNGGFFELEANKMDRELRMLAEERVLRALSKVLELRIPADALMSYHIDFSDLLLVQAESRRGKSRRKELLQMLSHVDLMAEILRIPLKQLSFERAFVHRLVNFLVDGVASAPAPSLTASSGSGFGGGIGADAVVGSLTPSRLVKALREKKSR